jgi:predicted nucleic acid-binding protein
MTRGLADTSVFIAREAGRELDVSKLPEELAVSVVTVGELRAGVLSAGSADVRAQRLATLEQVLELAPVPIDDAVEQAWARLRVALRDTGRRLRVNDSWIAATAMALEVPLVSQDGDYRAMPGLEVVGV